ncbi:amino acid aminotransferase [Chromohalobacter israelensis]|uniref:Aromatic amino acid aminotransferase apoenzyme n=1 Tax=Chromohalobacter israelensis (strain ATCC BAA-138 / DSM 3043 / CIP 106854 / NCIMB 13768 / 1H11) TaxID=290398 RepID=Q1QXY3_CHRI1|nr:amino acid aminotransferase [Chromohalobacter salexigens]ABE58675.1 aromatic amino acid aminotransferase apoenzyme [Chromohalobacter salexigens DSM 3043]MDO0944796.1 amino acid aminotransferase [Chromohalobacter salexigens]NWO54861.1 aspartate/tyrosine/aromatic aminotransferase [Chromohalobacter salexigens]
MFEQIERVPGDAILGLIEAFKKDPNPQKVDLGVGVYRDAHGNTPVMRAVKEAEARLLKNETTKSYIGSHGDPRYGQAVLELVLGAQSPVLAANRASATQSPGGTGALRLAADFIKSQLPGKGIWVSDPTWPNHLGIFHAAGVELKKYPYVDADNRLDFEGMLSALQQIPEGDVVLLHACCHNPSGFDLSREQWQRVLEVVRERRLLPLVDFAYQGFGDGLDADAYGPRLLAENLDEVMITSSCSKNFGVYRERTGCMIMIARDSEQMENVRSQMAIVARENYSNPPAHGGAVVAEILHDEALATVWREELTEMRDRINGLRRDFVEALKPYGLDERFAFIAEQRGMFSYTGLSPEQVDRLRDEFGIYMVRSGRANVAGLSQENLPYVAKAIAAVVG